MGQVNKLLQNAGSVPLIRLRINALQLSREAEIIVVTDHQADLIAESLIGLNVTLVHNLDWQAGLGASLKAGVSEVSEGMGDALILLADMPRVLAAVLDFLIDCFVDHRGKSAFPFSGGKEATWSCAPDVFLPVGR